MQFLKFNKNIKKSKNNLSFFAKKHRVSFKAYDLLKKFVINGNVSQEKLDFAYPQTWKPKILKNLSQRALRTLYRLSDIFKKNSLGVISQDYELTQKKKPLSNKAKLLLHKINNNEARYQTIDNMIKKYNIKKILD